MKVIMLSILYVRFTQELFAQTSHPKKSFNSLCEILGDDEFRKEVDGLDLSILYVRFRSLSSSLIISTSFPFNSLCEIHLQYWLQSSILIILSILYVRFRQTLLWYASPQLLPFNSLCEIRQRIGLHLADHLRLSILYVRFKEFIRLFCSHERSFFQFSMWDSVMASRRLQRRMDFQFSMWDSSGIGKSYNVLQVFFQFSMWDSWAKRNREASRRQRFQFSMWDSKPTSAATAAAASPFNSLCEIPKRAGRGYGKGDFLSILYVRFYKAEENNSERMANLSILYVRFYPSPVKTHILPPFCFQFSMWDSCW